MAARGLCLLIIAFLACMCVSSAYTVAFHGGNNNNKNIFTSALGASTLHSSPSAMHVADIVLRLSGRAPILREEIIQNMPSADVFSSQDSSSDKTLRVVEIMGGSLPSYVTPVMSSTTSSSSASKTVTGPKSQEIEEVLKQHGHKVEIVRVDGGDQMSVDKVIKAGNAPVVIVHSTASRILGSSSDVVAPLTEFQISEYQICLWTGVVLVLLVFSAVMSIANMETNPDSILLARFTSTRVTDKRA